MGDLPRAAATSFLVGCMFIGAMGLGCVPGTPRRACSVSTAAELSTVSAAPAQAAVYSSRWGLLFVTDASNSLHTFNVTAGKWITFRSQ